MFVPSPFHCNHASHVRIKGSHAEYTTVPCHPLSFNSSSLSKSGVSDSSFLCLAYCQYPRCIEHTAWAVAVVNIADVIVCLIGILLFVSQGAVIGIDDEDDSTFTITVDQKTFHFQGELNEEILSLHSPKCFFSSSFGCLLDDLNGFATDPA